MSFEGMHIAGLLQITDYTQALMLDSGLVPSAELAHRLDVRVQRRAILEEPKPPRLLAIVDELALRRLVGDADVMYRQLKHMSELARRMSISLRVIPNSGAHAGANGAFLLLRRTTGHKVVFLENLTSVLILEEPHEINRYEEAIRLLVRRALSQEGSAELIDQLAYRRKQGELA